MLKKNFAIQKFELRHDFTKTLKKSTRFGVQAVQLEKKVRTRAYAYFENKWGSFK